MTREQPTPVEQAVHIDPYLDEDGRRAVLAAYYDHVDVARKVPPKGSTSSD
jgi:hypothetical protein